MGIPVLNPARRAFLSPRRAEKYPPGKPYRPCNGTEGQMFMARWCENCKLDEGAPSGDGCPIIVDVMIYEIGDPEYPKEWRHGADGQPECKKFVDRDAPPPRPADAAGQGRFEFGTGGNDL